MQKPFFWVPGVHSNLPAPLVCWWGHAQIAALLSLSLFHLSSGVSTCLGFIFSGDSLSLARSERPSSQLTERGAGYGNRGGACNNYDKRSRRKVLNISRTTRIIRLDAAIKRDACNDLITTRAWRPMQFILCHIRCGLGWFKSCQPPNCGASWRVSNVAPSNCIARSSMFTARAP